MGPNALAIRDQLFEKPSNEVLKPLWDQVFGSHFYPMFSSLVKIAGIDCTLPRPFLKSALAVISLLLPSRSVLALAFICTHMFQL